jgi:hypothetical protein
MGEKHECCFATFILKHFRFLSVNFWLLSDNIRLPRAEMPRRRVKILRASPPPRLCVNLYILLRANSLRAIEEMGLSGDATIQTVEDRGRIATADGNCPARPIGWQFCNWQASDFRL